MEEALRFAREWGFQTVKELGIYEGWAVYAPDFTDGKEHAIGLPHYIFERGGKCKMMMPIDSPIFA